MACLSLYMPLSRNLRAGGETSDCCANLMVRYNLEIKEIPLHYSAKKVAKAEAAAQNRLGHRLRVCECFATFVSFVSLQSDFCCNSGAQTKGWLCKPFQASPGRNGGKSWLQIPDDCAKGCRPEKGACSGTFDVTWCTRGIVCCLCAWSPSSWQVLTPLVNRSWRPLPSAETWRGTRTLMKLPYRYFWISIAISGTPSRLTKGGSLRLTLF